MEIDLQSAPKGKGRWQIPPETMLHQQVHESQWSSSQQRADITRYPINVPLMIIGRELHGERSHDATYSLVIGAMALFRFLSKNCSLHVFML